MNAKEAADKIRPSFHLEQMPVEDRHHVVFVEAVAKELGIEPTAFNLQQVAGALDDANIHQDSNEYPKMFYSRRHHAVDGVDASVYDPRHDYVVVTVVDEDQFKSLGDGWVDNPADLPAREEIPVDADTKAAQERNAAAKEARVQSAVTSNPPYVGVAEPSDVKPQGAV